MTQLVECLVEFKEIVFEVRGAQVLDFVQERIGGESLTWEDNVTDAAVEEWAVVKDLPMKV